MSINNKQGGLVLARKRGEAIRIGDDIVIRILELGRSVARLHIKAPDGVKILREELLEDKP